MAHSLAASAVTNGTFDYITNHDHCQHFDMGELNKTSINGLFGRYAISTLMSQPFSGSAASATLTAIRASISQKFKPAAISSFVLLSSNSCSSALAASHKRSASPPIKLSDPPQVTHRDFEHYLHQIQGGWACWEKNLNIGLGGTASLCQSEIGSAESAAPIKFTTCQRS
ncbi:hypothetical protein PPACK8108_LOCUS7348 [Phakopsora pachyrhizi]|uniref:Uncharacterized protein n=1 Tax=Phakopsora pachyrhizi TaxID=170000 RepID=A0AAV0AUH5_PHAPC|nr:hypothetical protein PPACK8108_LOCUS7348 [Phakopsora pachyrhizi]